MVTIFLSAVSKEFKSYRDVLAAKLRRPNVTTHVQEDFIHTGQETLDKLDDYIKASDAVVHLIGDMTGAMAPPASVAALLARYPDFAMAFTAMPDMAEILGGKIAVSYTQWEALLAYYHKKELLIFAAAGKAARDRDYLQDAAQQASQSAHLRRLNQVNRFAFPEQFISQYALATEVLRSSILELMACAVTTYQPNTMPLASLGSLFKGRDDFMQQLEAALAAPGNAAAVTSCAIHGLGGIGKTRLAVEYAFTHRDKYSALLFISAESPVMLNVGLAALVGTDALNLPERDAPADDVRIAAAVRWLGQHPKWLMILDNVDSREARNAVQALLPRLSGGHILITARLTEFGAGVITLPLDTLSDESALALLNERTLGKRLIAPDDITASQELVRELDGLALGLEQAGAYISTKRISYGDYIKRWQDNRGKVLNWFDKDVVSYNRDVGLATTWATSVEQLSENGKDLLNHVAFLSAEPIPISLLHIKMVDAPDGCDPFDALGELYAYSLAEPQQILDGGFSVHRLVQDYAQRALSEADYLNILSSSTEWIDDAFSGEPQDVLNWPALDILLPHVNYILEKADKALILHATSRMMERVARLYYFKAKFVESEPLFRCSIKLMEADNDVNNLNLAAALSNFALLLQDVNKIEEAEELIVRAIDLAKYDEVDKDHVIVYENNLASIYVNSGKYLEAEKIYNNAVMYYELNKREKEHEFAVAINNLAQLLQHTNRIEEAEALVRRALEIDINVLGDSHPTVAVRLNNLAIILYSQGFYSEAERFGRRALEISESNYDSDHPVLAKRLNNLAQFLQAMNKMDEVEALNKRALFIIGNIYGENHPNYAIQLNNIGGLYFRLGNEYEASVYVQKAIKIFMNSGYYNPELPKILSNYRLYLTSCGHSESEISKIFNELGVT